MNLSLNPVDYQGMIQQGTGLNDLAQGLQVGLAIRKMREERAQAELRRQQQAQFQIDFQQAWDSKDPNSFTALIGKHPEFGSQFKQAYDMLSEQQKKNEFSTGIQIYSALQSGNTEVAKNLITNLKTAAANSGKPTNEYDFLLNGLDKDPQTAKNYMKMALSSVAPKDWAESMSKVGAEERAVEEQPVKMRESEAKAHTAEVTAAYSEDNAIKDLEKKGWDIENIKNDIWSKKEQVKIGYLNAQIAKEGNSLKGQELSLQRDKMRQDQNEKIQTRVADATSARDNMDNFLNTAEIIINNPNLKNVTGSIEGRRDTFLRDKNADVVALTETLKSQAFMASIPNMKGMGQLSENEGKRLERSIQSLDRAQSTEQYKASLLEAQRIIMKARKNLATRYGVPDTTPDVPAAGGRKPDVVNW